MNDSITNPKLQRIYVFDGFHKRLRTIRERTGMSQYHFATAAGIPEGTYWQYEDGRTKPPLPRLIALVNAHSLNIEELLGIQFVPAEGESDA